jgi:type II secretory ATPase GspE/PulE/Tfp pilus assembly ATPase PilB-like protein
MPATYAVLLRLGHPYLAENELAGLVNTHGADSLALVEAVVTAGLVPHADACRVWSERLGIAYIDPINTIASPEATALVPAEIVRKAQVLPLYVIDGVITLAMADPLDKAMVRRLEGITGLKISPMFALPTEIRAAIELRYSSEKDIAVIIKEMEDAGEVIALQHAPAELERLCDSKSLIRLADSLICLALGERASDIHIEPQTGETRVRLRVDGILEELLLFPKVLHRALISRVKIMCDLNISETRYPQDGRCTFKLGFNKVDFRVSFIPTIKGEKCVIRILGGVSKKGILSLDRMLISQAILKPLQRVIKAPNGIVFVTGPTGSGKTTTLYAALAQANTGELNVSTIEDPVEIELPGLTQSQTDDHIDLKFGMLLRALLRQDPDIILVGEIRDLETARIACEAALTGHLVFATLHTNNAIQAIARLMELGVEAYTVAPSILAVLGQRLAARICERCKESYVPSPEMIARYFEDAEGETPLFYVGRGCAACRHKGYKGRIAFHELAVVTEEMRGIIGRGGDLDLLTASARRAGYQPLRYDGLKKVLLGLTTIEELEANAPFEWTV